MTYILSSVTSHQRTPPLSLEQDVFYEWPLKKLHFCKQEAVAVHLRIEFMKNCCSCEVIFFCGYLQGVFKPQTRQEENREIGSVNLKLYLKYFYAGAGVIGLIVCLFVNLLVQVTYVLADWWLAYW